LILIIPFSAFQKIQYAQKGQGHLVL